MVVPLLDHRHRLTRGVLKQLRSHPTLRQRPYRRTHDPTLKQLTPANDGQRQGIGVDGSANRQVKNQADPRADRGCLERLCGTESHAGRDSDERFGVSFVQPGKHPPTELAALATGRQHRGQCVERHRSFALSDPIQVVTQAPIERDLDRAVDLLGVHIVKWGGGR